MNNAEGCQLATLPGGRRHFNHGPIDLIIEAFGNAEDVDKAYEQAWKEFQDILETLVSELPLLRKVVSANSSTARGPVARRMFAAVRPHSSVYVTPMAAVAGAVADQVLQAMIARRDLRRGYVNNGGDIAFYLAPSETLQSGIVHDIDRPDINSIATFSADCPSRGMATSGWSGRSFSLGIADSVTVLAKDAASADVAATLIGNAINVDHPAIERAPAFELDPDNDLGDRLVTVGVGALEEGAISQALDNGSACARDMFRAKMIDGALMTLKGDIRTIGAGIGGSSPQTAIDEMRPT